MGRARSAHENYHNSAEGGTAPLNSQLSALNSKLFTLLPMTHFTPAARINSND